MPQEKFSDKERRAGRQDNEVPSPMPEIRGIDERGR